MKEVVVCKKCSGSLKMSPDKVVICNHHAGPVHLGCCVNNCSMDLKPCVNSSGIYSKM